VLGRHRRSLPSEKRAPEDVGERGFLRTPKELMPRFRQPEGKLIQRVEVNGKPWARFDAN
jgi:hypothetical protein